jgi:hypothetical protein
MRPASALPPVPKKKKVILDDAQSGHAESETAALQQSKKPKRGSSHLQKNMPIKPMSAQAPPTTKP